MNQRPLRYVALGDSTAVGVGASSGGGYPDRLVRTMGHAGVSVELMNLGQSGATILELVRGPVQRAVALKPDLVTLGIGSNDVWRMIPVDTFGSTLKLIARALEGSGAWVVACTISDLTLTPAAALAEAGMGIVPGTFFKRLALFNEQLSTLARRPRFSVADIYTVSHRELPQRPDFISPDGFHPSALGYERWAQLMWPEVERALWEIREGVRP